jgi:hypothetical protein
MARFLSLDELFEGRHFDREIFVLAREVVPTLQAQLPGPGRDYGGASLSMVHSTIMRWVHLYAPEFERRWKRFARPAGPSWRVDETYVKVRRRVWCKSDEAPLVPRPRADPTRRRHWSGKYKK